MPEREREGEREAVLTSQNPDFQRKYCSLGPDDGAVLAETQVAAKTMYVSDVHTPCFLSA